MHQDLSLQKTKMHSSFKHLELVRMISETESLVVCEVIDVEQAHVPLILKRFRG